MQNFLLADDNGVFDLFLDTAGTYTNGVKNQLIAQWGFTQADYQAAPSLVSGPNRTGLTFLPTSLQRTGTEAVNGYLMGHYIVANGYSQGQVTPASGIGGEVLELNSNNPTLVTQVYSAFSKPSNTSPLSQPAFAVRAK